jgi:fructose-1,6-bisphosphatase I
MVRLEKWLTAAALFAALAMAGAFYGAPANHGRRCLSNHQRLSSLAFSSMRLRMLLDDERIVERTALQESYTDSLGPRSPLDPGEKIYPAHTRQKTFSRFIEVETWKHPELAAIQPVMKGIESACKGIARLVRRAQCDDISGMYGDGEVNVQGEAQKVMDVLANRILIASMCTPGKMDYVASEEEEEPTYCAVFLENAAFRGDYAGVFDPLDGSSNIEAGLPVGTIFGIYRRPELMIGPDRGGLEAIMQTGSQLLASGYCLYGGQTVMVCTLGHGVHAFTLDESGEFILTQRDMRIPEAGKIYSFNEGNSLDWDPRLLEYLRKLKTGTGMAGRRYDASYIGALVADVHRIITMGGVYGYPGTDKTPNGKIRLLYEANPISMLVEQAGGMGSTGFRRILDIVPESVHQRVPTFIGSVQDIEELCSHLAGLEPHQSGEG